MALVVGITIDGRSLPAVPRGKPLAEYPVVSGLVRWETTVTGGDASLVQYRVDDRLAHEERVSPYVFNGKRYATSPDMFDTRKLSDGVHKLSCRVYVGDHGEYPMMRRTDRPSAPLVIDTYGGVYGSASAPASEYVIIRVNVRNAPAPAPAPPSASLTQTIAEGAQIAGPTRWEAKASAPVSRVEFLVDGAVRHTENVTPYEWKGTGTLIPSDLGAGEHLLVTRATLSAGGTIEARARVNVVSTSPPPSPPPAPSDPTPAPLWDANLASRNLSAFTWLQTYFNYVTYGDGTRHVNQSPPEGVPDLRLNRGTEPVRKNASLRFEVIEGQEWGGTLLRSGITGPDEKIWGAPMSERKTAVPGSVRALGFSIYFPDDYHPTPELEYNVVQGLHLRTGFHGVPWDPVWAGGPSGGQPRANPFIFAINTWNPEWPLYFDVPGGQSPASLVKERTVILNMRIQNAAGAWVKDPAVWNRWHDLVWEARFEHAGTVGNSPGWYSLWHRTADQAAYRQLRNRSSTPTLLYDDFPYFLAENYLPRQNAVLPADTDGVHRSVFFQAEHKVGRTFAEVAV